MEDRKQTTIPTAGTDIATVAVALELSRSKWVIAVQSTGDESPRLHTRDAYDVAFVVELVASARSRLAGQGKPVQVVCLYEAGRDGFWLQRELEARGIPTVVIDAASVETSRRRRRAKTDRIDVKALMRKLRAYLYGDRDVFRLVPVPRPEDEDARRTVRLRDVLIAERVAHINRIKGWCAQEGIADYEPIRLDRRVRLEQLRTFAGQPLPPALLQSIALELDRLELLLQQIATLERARDAVVHVQAAQRAPEAKIQALAKLRAIGVQSATQLTREVFYRQFRNRRQLGSYMGLTGSPWSSGALNQEQGISKAGNARARKAMVELAWSWLRYQPDSALSQWFLTRTALHKGRVRRIAIVALARKLVIALWRYVEEGVIPHGAKQKSDPRLAPKKRTRSVPQGAQLARA